jgi:metallophosphoesterase superfamily enzyme
MATNAANNVSEFWLEVIRAHDQMVFSDIGVQYEIERNNMGAVVTYLGEGQVAIVTRPVADTKHTEALIAPEGGDDA